MQAAGRPSIVYMMRRSPTSGQNRRGFPRGHRMPPSYICLFMLCERRSFSGRGMVVMNFSTGLYADPAFNSVSVFALHRRLKRAVCCPFGLGALRQSCFSCSPCAASSVSPCAVALAVGAACCVDAACCVVGFTFRLALLILCGKLRALPLPASCACWFAVNVR